MAKDIAPWMRQNMKKGASPSAPHEMNAKLHGGANSMHSKIAKPTHPMGGMCSHGYADGGMVYMADGGDVSAAAEAALKQRGLEASANEKVGFFERLRMGNIDEPGSKAYNEFGAGRAKGDDAQTARENAVNLRKAEANRRAESSSVDLSMPSDDMRAGIPAEPEAPKTTAADFQKTDKDTTPVKTAARPVKPAPTGGGRTTMSRDMDERRTDRTGGGRTTMANDPRRVKEGAPLPRNFDPTRDQSFGEYVSSNFRRVFGTQAMRDEAKKK